jgi:hypothetical protein
MLKSPPAAMDQTALDAIHAAQQLMMAYLDPYTIHKPWLATTQAHRMPVIA